MTQPEYVPLSRSDRVRASERLPAPDGWKAERPADFTVPAPPEGPGFGRPGPDQGFALKLARRFADKLQLAPGEHADDAVGGCLGVALKRASRYGRAPVIYDLEFAFTLWGFLGDAPADLIEFRRPLFAGADHHYWDKRDIADLVPDATLHLTPSAVRAQLGSWRSLITVPE